jgi:hypothetical protein
MKQVIILLSVLLFFPATRSFTQELPRADLSTCFYMFPIYEEMRQQGYLTYEEKNAQMVKMKSDLGEGNLYHQLGFSMIFSPTFPEFRDIFYLSQKHGLHLGLIFDLQSHTRDDYANVAAEDLRLFQWRNDGVTWEGEMTPDRRGYRIPTPSRYAKPLIEFNTKKAEEWADAILQLMEEYPGVLTVANGPIEEELAGGGAHDKTKLGDYSPYAITEFRDWLRHTGIYDDSSGKYAGEGASALIIGDPIDFNGVLRSQFYDDPTPAESNGTGVSFNEFFGTHFTTWSLQYWDLEMYPNPITDTEFNCTPSYGEGYCSGGFDAPRISDMDNVFWRAWSYEVTAVDSYPPGNPGNPAFGFRQVLVRNFIRDLFDILASRGIPRDMIYAHQIPDEVLNDLGRELASSSPTWSGYMEKSHNVGITRFGDIDPAIMTQYANKWGVFEWHTAPDTDPQSETLYDISTNALHVYYTHQCQTLWPGWWKETPPTDDETFPLNDSKFAEAIHDFMTGLDELPYTQQGGEVPDYIPPQVTGTVAAFYDTGQLDISWSRYIWDDLSIPWDSWQAFDHFEVALSADGSTWENETVTVPELRINVSDTSYLVRVRAVSAAGKQGPWSNTIHSAMKLGQTNWEFMADHDSLPASPGILNEIIIKNVDDAIVAGDVRITITGSGTIQNTVPANREQIELFWPMNYSNETQQLNGLENPEWKAGVFSAVISATEPIDPYFFIPVNTFSGQQFPNVALRIYSEQNTMGQLFWFYDDQSDFVEYELHPGWQVIHFSDLPGWSSVPNISKVRIDAGTLGLNHIMVDWVAIASVPIQEELVADNLILQEHLLDVLTSPTGEEGAYTVRLEYQGKTDSITIATYGQNQLPEVSMTLPAHDTIIEVGKPVTLQASAHDGDGKIMYVGFLANDTAFYHTYESPYAFSVTPPIAGNYEIVAEAVDYSGGKNKSTAVNVQVVEQLPYPDSAPHVPCIIEAENYDRGGSLIAYYDHDTINQGGAYRQDGVDIAPLSRDDGYYVGWTQPGEWLEYTIRVDTGMKTEILLSVAYAANDGEIHLELDGRPVTPHKFIKSTGGELHFQDILMKDVFMGSGTHQLRIAFDRGTPNIDRFEIRKYEPVLSMPYSKDKVIVYPNPAWDIIKFSFEDKAARTLEIFNLSGKIILRSDLTPKNEYYLPIDHLNAGYYFIRITTNGKSIVGRFIKR